MWLFFLHSFAVFVVGVSAADYSYCSMYDDYNVLLNLTKHNSCLDVKKMFELLHGINPVENKPSCRMHIIRVLAQHFGPNASTPHSCKCDGNLDLARYYTNVHDGTNDYRVKCYSDNAAYKTLYNQFFQMHHLHAGQCRTHDSVWFTLNQINSDGNDHDDCQREFILHLRYSFKHHSDGCECTDVYIPSTHLTTNLAITHDAACLKFDSYTKLMQLKSEQGCMSANSVWHYLYDLQVKNPECRRKLQHYMAERDKHHHSSYQDSGICSCQGGAQLVNHHVHLKNGSLNLCLHTNGTYSAILHNFLRKIHEHGCQNHNILWTQLEGVNNHCIHYGHHGSCDQWTDCQQDLIHRATLQYPTDASDSCVCSKVSIDPTYTNAPKTSSTTPKQTTVTPKHITVTQKQTVISTQTTTTKRASATSIANIPTASYTPPLPPTELPDFVCNEVLAVEFIALAQHTTHSKASPCDPSNGGSDDAYVLSSCNVTSPMTWKRGTNIMSDCKNSTHSIPGFTPISTFVQDSYIGLGSQSGVFIECLNNGGFKMAVQKCNSHPVIIHIEGGGQFNNDPKNYYVIV